MSSTGAWIVQTGMVTAVGIGSAQTASSVRAGISRYQESTVYNKRFEPMTLALLPDAALPPLHDDLAELPGLTSRQTRMLRIADGALKEVLKDLNLKQPPALFLAGPEVFADRPPALTAAFVQYLMTQTDVKLDATHSAVFSAGRAGGLLALRAALALLAQGSGKPFSHGRGGCRDVGWGAQWRRQFHLLLPGDRHRGRARSAGWLLPRGRRGFRAAVFRAHK